MRKHINSALKILQKVYTDGTYSNMAFYGEKISDMSTRLVYGTLEEDVKTEYILNQLIDKKPQKLVYVLLKIGTYALLNLTDVPPFAIVSECVEVAKLNGKSGASGFVNAVLKKVAQGAYSLPNENDEDYLSVTYSKPKWFIDKLIAQYGKEDVVKMLEAPQNHLEHIRVNSRLATPADVESLLKKDKQPIKRTAVGGYAVKADDCIKRAFDKGLVTYQSPSSMLAVRALNPIDGASVLDLCSAPGGKAIYMSELCPHSFITACDLHEHRVQLIQKYKNRMHTPNVKAVQKDACVFDEGWKDKFDYVLVDAPCSCFGTFRKHPDVFLSRAEKDVDELCATQGKLLQNASKYVKIGGKIVYSTCTLFREENQNVVKAFLDNNDGFEVEIPDLSDVGIEVGKDGFVQLLPHDEYDGFFIAKLRRTK